MSVIVIVKLAAVFRSAVFIFEHHHTIAFHADIKPRLAIWEICGSGGET